MNDVLDLRLPVVGAPMAGVTTPALVGAVTAAGGLGMLAAGYRTPEQVADDLDEVRRSGHTLFGINLFVPGTFTGTSREVLTHRDRLAAAVGCTGQDLPWPEPDDDAYAAKLALVAERAVPLVSFTFGAPTRAQVRLLHRASSEVAVTVTSAVEALHAQSVGADLLVVQSHHAGGHRGTFDPADPGGTQPLPDLLAEVAAAVGHRTPLIAAGGIGDARSAARALGAGARAVQVGTVLLGANEAGTHPAYLCCLLTPQRQATVRTRVFTGRTARGLVNRATRTWPDPPPAYPEVHQLTRPLRAAAAKRGDAEEMSLWAGTSVVSVRRAPAGTLIADIMACAASGEAQRGTG